MYVLFLFVSYDLISQELCLLCGIIKQKIVVYIVVTGPPLMETTLATAIGKEAGTIIITGIVTFTMITGQNLGTILIFTMLIMLIMLDMMLFDHL